MYRYIDKQVYPASGIFGTQPLFRTVGEGSALNQSNNKTPQTLNKKITMSQAIELAGQLGIEYFGMTNVDTSGSEPVATFLYSPTINEITYKNVVTDTRRVTFRDMGNIKGYDFSICEGKYNGIDMYELDLLIQQRQQKKAFWETCCLISVL